MTAHKLLNPQSHIVTIRVSLVSHFRPQRARWQHLMKCSTTVDVWGEKLVFIPKKGGNCSMTFLGNVKCDNMSAGFSQNVTNLPLFVCTHATLPRRPGTPDAQESLCLGVCSCEEGRREADGGEQTRRRWEDRVISPSGGVAGNQACDRVF